MDNDPLAMVEKKSLICREGCAEGLSIAVERISAHLGTVKSNARPGSVSAALQTLGSHDAISKGLRVAVLGVKMGTAIKWTHKKQRLAGGLPAGVKVIAPPQNLPVLSQV